MALGGRYPGALPATDPNPLISLNVLNPIFLHATFEHPSDEVVPACVLSLQALLNGAQAEQLTCKQWKARMA